MKKILLIFLLFLSIHSASANYEKTDYKKKLGSLLIFNVTPQAKEEFLKVIINKYHISNFNLIGQYNNKEEVLRIINIIKNNSRYRNTLIAVDQEGEINRLLFQKTKPQSEINLNNAQKTAYITGIIIKNLNFNVNFSPVLDFTTNTKDYIYIKELFSKTKKIPFYLEKE